MYCLIKATLFYKNVLAVFILVISGYFTLFQVFRTRLIIRRVAKMRIGHTAAVWLGTPFLKYAKIRLKFREAQLQRVYDSE